MLDSDLSGGQRYPIFEQPGPGEQTGFSEKKTFLFISCQKLGLQLESLYMNLFQKSTIMPGYCMAMWNYKTALNCVMKN